jgi:serine/threonine protein kinase
MGASSHDPNTVCFTLSRGAFEQIISPSAAQQAIVGASEVRQQDNHAIKLRHQRDDTASEMSFDNFQLGQVIGVGGFSIVRFAMLKTSREVYAVKVMNKAEIFARNQVAHVINERRVLASVSHPFVLNLIKTFQTRNQLFMVLELMQGGELFSRVLKSAGGLPLHDASFYAACVVEGLDFLHRKHVVYRDLKLENLVIGNDGYLKIVDFGFAKVLPEGSLTRTLCGTADYLAPECITHKGHNQLVDCWDLGVLIYEMLTQYSPFADPSNKGNRMIVFQNIMRGLQRVDWNELSRPFRAQLDRQAAAGTLLPETIRAVNEVRCPRPLPLTPRLQDFARVQNLLTRLWDPNPLTRANMTAVKHHVFFSSWNWTALRELSVPPPWLPQLSGNQDLQYFDVEGMTDARESTRDFEGDDGIFNEF